MSENRKFGLIEWADLTVPNADEVREFYEKVVGWKSEGCLMGDHEDFVMSSSDGEDAVGGVCHKRGNNADMPSQWMIYIVVEDLEASMAACTANGGRIVAGPKSMSPDSRYCVIEDPAGAVCALFWKRV